MFNVVLVEPEIPPNTGNIIRLCANTGCQLHLIEPLGFPLEDAKMRRAGLDYREFMTLKVYKNWDDFIDKNKPDLARVFVLTTHGSTEFTKTNFQQNDYFVFGSETKGLNTKLRESFAPEKRIRLPMLPNNRSLNLSNSVAVIIYEAWRQNDFIGGV